MRIVIVDDHMLFAQALAPALEADGLELVGVACDGAQAERLVTETRPDIVLVDIGLPDRSGLAVGSDILRLRPETKVVALTALTHPELVREALSLGFHGYLTKDMNVSRFLASLRAIDEGQVVVPRELARGAAGRPRGDWQIEILADQLTPREHQVLELVARAVTGHEIARHLSISDNTVRTHIQSILTKLQVHSRLEAAAFAIRHGIVDVPRPGHEWARGGERHRLARQRDGAPPHRVVETWALWSARSKLEPQLGCASHSAALSSGSAR